MLHYWMLLILLMLHKFNKKISNDLDPFDPSNNLDNIDNHVDARFSCGVLQMRDQSDQFLGLFTTTSLK